MAESVKRAPAWVSVVGLLLAICIAGLAAATPRASAVTFCGGVTLAPYGQGGDRCWGPSRESLNFAAVVTYQRAGCVNIASSSNVLLQSWVCGAAGSAPQYAASVTYLQDPRGFHKGVIRNNNLSYSATFSGNFGCANGCTS